MKKTIYYCWVLFAAFAFASCDLNDDKLEPGTYITNILYATTFIVEDTANDDEEICYFEVDKGTKLFLADNRLSSKYTLTDGQRVVLYFTPIEDYSQEGSESLEGAAYDCDFGIRLFGIRNVFMGQCVTVTDQEENEAIVDHALAAISPQITVTGNYIITLYAAIQADDTDDVKFHLVENKAEEAKNSEEGYLDLELRYDRGTDQEVGYTYEEYISLDAEPFAELIDELDGVRLRVLTKNSGTVYFKLDFPKDDERNISSTSVPAKSLIY